VLVVRLLTTNKTLDKIFVIKKSGAGDLLRLSLCVRRVTKPLIICVEWARECLSLSKGLS